MLTLHVFAQFPFTTSELELDYYHQKVNVQVASRAVDLGSNKIKTFQDNS